MFFKTSSDVQNICSFVSRGDLIVHGSRNDIVGEIYRRLTFLYKLHVLCTGSSGILPFKRVTFQEDSDLYLYINVGDMPSCRCILVS